MIPDSSEQQNRDEHMGFVELTEVLEEDDARERVLVLLSQADAAPDGLPASEVMKDESVTQMTALYGLTAAKLLKMGNGKFEITETGRNFLRALETAA